MVEVPGTGHYVEIRSADFSCVASPSAAKSQMPNAIGFWLTNPRLLLGLVTAYDSIPVIRIKTTMADNSQPLLFGGAGNRTRVRK